MAFAGAGMISMIHALAAEAIEFPILAVASRTPAHASERAGQIGCRTIEYGDLPAGADLVLVATPPALHAVQSIDALRTGASVLVEKPLATSLADGDALVMAASSSPGVLVYAENLAFAPVVGQALVLISGLGQLDLLDIRALSPRPSWGDFLTPGWGGGCLFDLGAHPIALALLAAGDDAPVQVSARLQRSPDIEVDDHAVVELDFASGLRTRIEVSWRDTSTTWDLQASSATGVVRAELLPLTGLEHNGEPVELPSPPPNIETFVHELGYVEQLHQVRCLIGEDGTDADPAETETATARAMNAAFGQQVLEIICAAYSSAGRSNGSDPTPESIPFSGRRDRTPHQLWLDPGQ
jgi:hypothetical protein